MIWFRIGITVTLIFLALARSKWPDLKFDAITLTLLIGAAIPWLSKWVIATFKSIKLPGGWEFEFRELRKATNLQTFATIISWINANDIRESRRLLYHLEETQSISARSIDEWEEEWRQAADRASQAFNNAAIVALSDSPLHEQWIHPTRRAIVKTWHIVQPRVMERREEQSDLWKEFESLATKATESCTSEERKAWNIDNPIDSQKANKPLLVPR